MGIIADKIAELKEKREKHEKMGGAKALKTSMHQEK